MRLIMYKLIKTTLEDENKILTIYKAASVFLAQQGINQWQNNYPNAESFNDDILRNISYKLVNENNEILAVASLDTAIDPNYAKIYEGHWLKNNAYATIHRIAVNQEIGQKGLGYITFQKLIERARQLDFKEVRIDTHPNNKIMQHLITKIGFEYRGIILVKDGSQRLAYQLFLE